MVEAAEHDPRALRDFERLRADELGIEGRLAVLEEHVDDFTKVRVKFVQRLSLGVRARPTGDVSDEQARLLVAFDDSSECAHINDLGKRVTGPGDIRAAIDAHQAAITLDPSSVRAHIRLGLAHHEHGDLDAAISVFDEAITLEPGKAEAHYNLAISLHDTGNLRAATASYERALRLKPDYADAHNNLATTLLLFGDYTRGWQEYEYRFDLTDSVQNYFRAKLKTPPWPGGEFTNGDRLLLIAEQGLGDTLQFMRYASHLREQGVVVSLCAQPQLTTLIQASGIDPAPV